MLPKGASASGSTSNAFMDATSLDTVLGVPRMNILGWLNRHLYDGYYLGTPFATIPSGFSPESCMYLMGLVAGTAMLGRTARDLLHMFINRLADIWRRLPLTTTILRGTADLVAALTSMHGVGMAMRSILELMFTRSIRFVICWRVALCAKETLFSLRLPLASIAI